MTCFGHVHEGGDPGVDPGHVGEIISLSWPGSASVFPQRSLQGQVPLVLAGDISAPATQAQISSGR